LRVLPNVSRTEVREQGLVGTVFAQEGASNRPAIIDLTGSGGGMSETRAALLASHGYVSMALAYFGTETLPQALLNIPLEYFGTAIGFLKQHEAVDPERIGVIGRSRGGELSLLLGVAFSDIKCVVGYVPSAFCCPGDGGAAWTLAGKPLPFITSTGDERIMAEIQRSIAAGEATSFRPMFTSILDDRDAIRDTEIPVEKINGCVLLISGDDDQMWPSSEMSEIVVQRLRDNDFSYEYKHLSYPDAGHMIGYPYKPTTVSDVYHPVNGLFMKLGGTPAGDAHASSDSWQHLLDFLDSSFGSVE
jgi:dienelactone hydrolase